MAYTINDAKEMVESFAPLHLFDFFWADGTTLSVCSHAVTYLGVPYEARVESQQIDPIQEMAPSGIVVPPSIRMRLADADKAMYGVEAAKKFRGARVHMRFVYYDFAAGVFSSDAMTPFVGRCSEPEVLDDALNITAGFILNLAAKNLPTFPVSARCPKLFPFTAAMKALADTKGAPYYACGVTDPTKVTCDFTPVGCAANANSPRFGGITYQVPPGSHSREYTSGNWLDLVSDVNAAYGDYAPIGYGTAWVDCKSLGSWPEANSTRGEAIVCEGRPRRILKVTVNDEEVPASNDLDYNAYHVADPLFRYDISSNGDRTGRLNPDHPWNGAGDPHGSLCVIEWVVYHKVTTGTPRVRALVEFPPVHAYARIDTVVGGVATLAANRPNRDITGTVRVFGNSNAALNATWTATSWAYGPPGTLTLPTGASGNGGWIEYDTPGSHYAWAVRDALERGGLALADTDLEGFADAHEKFSALVDYTARYSNEWASGVTYEAGAVEHHGGANYLSLQGGNTNHEPGVAGSEDWWSVTDAAPAAQPTGVTSQHAKYKCSLVIGQRRTAEEIVAGLLRGCDSHLKQNLATGQIGLCARGSLAQQQPAAMNGSNYNVAIAGGYVAYRFSEASMARATDGRSTLRRVARADTAVPNSVTIAFSNEDNDYSGDSARVVDPDDINLMGQEIVGQWQAEGCTSLDRANRVGSIFLATQIEGRPWEFETTAKAVRLQAGDIVAIDNAKHGFALQLARVMKIAPQENWKRATITVALHDDAWYADGYQRGPSSGAVAPQRPQAARPPRVWGPNLAAPAAGDPLYATSEKTFGVGLGYELLKGGTPQPAIAIKGVAPVNAPANLQAPVIGAQGFTANAGGTIAGDGAVYFAAVASLDGTAKPGALSNVCQIVVAQAGSTNTITIPVGYLDPAGAGFAVYVGRNPARMTRQDDTLHGVGAPAAITVTALLEAGEGAPDTVAAAVVVRPRVVQHYGPWAAEVNVVGAGTLQFTGAGWPAGQWVGCDCTLLAKLDGSDLPVLNFHVTASTADTLTVTPDPNALGVATGDLIGMLPLPTIAGFVITDARWMNTLSGGGAGLAPHAEKGRYWRWIAGAGRGYRYLIVDNTATAVTVQGPWVVTPDGTSRGVIEDAAPLDELVAAVANGDPAATLSIVADVSNYAGKVLLLETAVRSATGLESAGALNPVRCVYVAGELPVRVVFVNANVTLDAVPQTVSADATGGAFTVTLPLMAGWVGQDITIVKTDGTANAVNWATSGADVVAGFGASGALTEAGQSITITATEA